MPARFTYAQLLEYLVGLGRRHRHFAQSEAGNDPAGEGSYRYPLLYVEDDTMRETTGNNMGQYSVAWNVLVMDRPEVRALLGIDRAPTSTELKGLAEQLGDELEQQMRDEQQVEFAQGGQPTMVTQEEVGTDLATGARFEGRLLVASGINRRTNRTLFEPLA